MIPDILFLLFSAGILLGGALVAVGKNPMVGILGMLLAFLNASGLFILLGAEFLGLLLIMVYVGAVAVMFLFVLMTIDIDFAQLREWGRGTLSAYLPAGLLVVGALGTLLILAATGTPFNLPTTTVIGEPAAENIVQLGRHLFTAYAIPFQISGLLLLVAMIGAIGLTHAPRSAKGLPIKRQNIGQQIARTREEAFTLVTPATGKGAKVTHWEGKSVAKKVRK